MRIFILGDLEGAAGVVDFHQQTYSDAKYYEQAKRLSTLEVNALVDGVLEGGAQEVWFLDGHGPGGIDYELMHPEVQMIIGRPISAPWGLDESFDAFLLYGHHSMGNTERGVLCHSWSSRTIANCWLNGELMGRLDLTPHSQARSASQRYSSVGTIPPSLKRRGMYRISCR